MTDGKFEIQMIIPKDINYKVEYGRLSMYAYDVNNGWDAMGSNDSFLIGGSASDVESDNIGPNISLTTNGNKYKDGYNVNPNPMIYVELSDASGINVTGSSVGHNITLIIDDDTKNVISLNSYFKYNIGSCTEGKVEYHIGKNLSEGWHTIKVKAWDLQNNLSESSIRIFVTEKLAPEIEQDFKITPAQLESLITDKTKVLLLCSPSNPTGSVYSKEELKGLAEVLANHPQVYIIADEIYEHINYVGKHESIAQFAEVHDRVIIVNGVSKAYAMTGWHCITPPPCSSDSARHFVII